MKNKIQKHFLIALLLFSAYCKGFSGVFTDDKPAAFMPGSVINLPTSSGGFQSATVIDMNRDGVADGLDLNGDGIPEILFITLNASRAVGLDLNGDGVIDYYLIINFDGSNTLQTARTGGSPVKVTTDASGATGFDTVGAGGSAQDILTQIRNDATTPTIGASPAGGTFAGPQSITLTCSDSVACNAIAYTTDGSTPSFSGSGNTIVVGKSAGLTVSATSTIRYITRDAKGNVSGIGQHTYTINSGVSTYSIGGTVSGLSGTLVLQNNGGDNLSLTTNGSFTFSTAIAQNATYGVTVLTQPVGQTCTVSNGSGTVNASNVTSVGISCASLGIAWTGRSILGSQPQYYFDITFGNGLFVAVGGNPSDKVATSPDGVNWTARLLPVSGYNWKKIAYGAGKFVAITGTSVGITSPDGITWTQQAQPDTFELIAYQNSTFLATVVGSVNYVYTSADGINWISRTIPVTSRWNGIAVGGGRFALVPYSSGSTTTISSTDGISWASGTITANAGWQVTYGAGKFVAIGSGNPSPSRTSTDGLTWAAGGNLPVTTNWPAVSYGNGVFIAVNEDVAPNSSATSTDGISWVARTMPGAGYKAITYGDAKFVAVGLVPNAATSP